MQREAARRTSAGRRADQPRHAGRAGADRHRRRHASDLPAPSRRQQVATAAAALDIARRAPAPCRPTSIRRATPSRRRARPAASPSRPRPRSKPAAAPRSTASVASAAPRRRAGATGGFFGSLFAHRRPSDQPAEPRAADAEAAEAEPVGQRRRKPPPRRRHPAGNRHARPSRKPPRADKPQPAAEPQQRERRAAATPASGTGRACSIEQRRRAAGSRQPPTVRCRPALDDSRWRHDDARPLDWQLRQTRSASADDSGTETIAGHCPALVAVDLSTSRSARTARGSACTSCPSRTGRPRCGRPCPRSTDRSDCARRRLGAMPLRAPASAAPRVGQRQLVLAGRRIDVVRLHRAAAAAAAPAARCTISTRISCAVTASRRLLIMASNSSKASDLYSLSGSRWP